MNPVADTTAFTVSGRDVPWTEVVAYARHTGAWDVLVEQVMQGIVLSDSPHITDASPEVLREVSNSFRYSHGLIAGDELLDWLTRWGLTVASWQDHIRRTWLIETHTPSQVTVTEQDELNVVGALWTSAVCSGTLEKAAVELAGLLAAGDWLGPQIGAPSSPYDVRARLATQLGTDKAIASNLQMRALDWIRIESSVLRFDDPDAAREALSLLRDDGLRADEVATLAQVSCEQHSDHLIDVGEDRRAAFLAACEGDVLGPLPADDGFHVVMVHSKRSPTVHDPRVQVLAVESLVDRLIRRETDDRVVWHGGQ